MSKDHRDDHHNDRSNAPKPRKMERYHVTREELRKTYRGKEAFSVSDVFILVRVPYNERINGLLRGMGGVWDSKQKRWKVHASHNDELKRHIDEIEKLFHDDWIDHLNATRRETEHDTRVWVSEANLGDYPEGHLVFHAGREWTVTYVGRPKDHGADGIRHPVYLERYVPQPLSLPAAKDFDDRADERDWERR